MVLRKLSHADSMSVWNKWITDPALNILPYERGNFNAISKRSGLFQKFDSMLYDNGGYVMQDHGKRHIAFYDEHDALAFLLKYA